MEKETKKSPNLTNIENFKTLVKPGIKPDIKPVIKPVVKFNLNNILLILFCLFLIFFLYNCKYGMFKIIDSGPIPYSLMSLV